MFVSRLAVSALILSAVLGSSSGQSSERYAKVVEQILGAWKAADVVCLGEDHDRFYDNEVRVALVRHPEFPRLVRAIVVELANPVHQDLLDRFILNGAPLSREELAPTWRDASNPEVWESPIYEEFLRAIRDVNLGLPRALRVRVLGGDSKVDWAKITRPEDLIPFMNRGGNIREIIATQVVDNHLKALAIYGAGHCNKMGTGFPGELSPRYGKERFWSISPLIRTAGVEKARGLFGLGPDPAYIPIAGSLWESLNAGDFLIPGVARFKVGQVYDAIVYHGDVADRVVSADIDRMRSQMGPELDRRARILAEAIKIRKH